MRYKILSIRDEFLLIKVPSVVLENESAVPRVVNNRVVAADCSQSRGNEETFCVGEGVRLVNAALNYIRRHRYLAVGDHD